MRSITLLVVFAVSMAFSADAILIESKNYDLIEEHTDNSSKPLKKGNLLSKKRVGGVDIESFQAALNVWKDLRPINTLQDFQVSEDSNGAEKQSFKEIIEDRIEEMKAWTEEKPRQRDFIITESDSDKDKTE